MEYVGDKADAAKSQPAEPAQQPVTQPAVAPAPVKEPVKTVQPTVEKHTTTVEHKAEPHREHTPVVQEKKQPKPATEKATAQPTQTVKKSKVKFKKLNLLRLKKLKFKLWKRNPQPIRL